MLGQRRHVRDEEVPPAVPDDAAHGDGSRGRRRRLLGDVHAVPAPLYGGARLLCVLGR